MSEVLERARAWVARRATGPQYGSDRWVALPPRLPGVAWLVGVCAVLGVYLFTFMHVHVVADTRLCALRLDDPIMAILPLDRRWFFITIDVYVTLTLAAIALLFLQAYLGDHRPIIRWGLGLAICGAFRDATILLVPLCRATREVGTAVLPAVPHLDLGFVQIPWRMIATNDLLFSGHICELILLIRATRSWPPWARVGLWTYQVLQIYGLLTTRGHYLVDIIVAIPVAICADHAAYQAVTWLTGRSATVREPR